MYIDLYGRRAVAIDRKQENALAVYNAQNIIKISNRKTFARQTDGLRIKFVNSKDDLFQEDTYLVMREDNGKPRELTYESLIKDVSVTGVTEYEHVVKHARRLMAIEALRPKVTTIEVGNEGIFYTPMSKVLIQDDCLKIGLGNAVISGCDWRGGRLKKIYLNGTVPVPDVDKAYGVIVNCFTRDGGKPVAIKVEAERDGDVSELTVVSAVRISDDAVPDVGNVLSFGELDADGGFSRVTTPYIINGIKRGEKGFSLELVNYHEAVYDAGAIPEYHSNLTRRQGTLPPPIPKDYGGITRDELEKALARVDGTKAAQEAADLIVHGVRYTDTHYIRDVEMSLPDIVKRIDNDARTLSSSIEMSEEQILLKVEDTAQGLRSFIAVTKEQILAEAQDLKRELKGLLAVQAGAVKAMVEGGGAAGQLALSLELPAMIDKKTFNKFVEKCGGEATAKVYARLAGTDYYAIRGDISGKPVKALWDKAVKAGLLASQIQLNADQIVVQNGDKVAAAFVDGKLRAACIDAENLIVQQLKIDSDKQSNQDFEAYFDKNRGLQIRNKGADILKIDPKTGEAFFTGKVQAGAVELADKGVFIRNGEVTVENKGWKAAIRPCSNGVELAILGGDGGNMTKKQLWTYISGGILNLFVLGSVTSCGGMYHSSPDGDMKNKKSGTDGTIRSIASDGNTIMVRADGEILISKDNGNTWSKKANPINQPVSHIAYNNNVWIVTGNNKIAKSIDGGNTWVKKWEVANKGLYTVAGNENTWVAVGYNGLILISNDNGDTWIDKTNQNFTGNLYLAPVLSTVSFGNNTWIVTGSGNTYGSQIILISKDNGNTWTQKKLFAGLIVSKMTYGNGTWIAVANGNEHENNKFLISKDNGNSWIQKVPPIKKVLTGIAFGNNLWMAVGHNGLILISNDNGDTWTQKASPTGVSLTDISYTNPAWIAGGIYGTILSSVNAVTWQ